MVCGGLRCGCTSACDNDAILKIDGSVSISGTLLVDIQNAPFKVTSVSHNSSFGCGLKSDGTVWCWGNNSYGSLGNGDTTVASSNYPLEVVTAVAGPALTGITAIQVADYGYNACAVGASGAVYCWGYGTYGELGNGSKNNSFFAVPVVDASNTPVTGFAQVAVDYYHACGLKTDKTVWCWGDNQWGEIGNAMMASSSSPVVNPVQVTGVFSTATSIMTAYVSGSVSCAGTDDGGVSCWGYDSYGDLGDGMMSGMALSPTPVKTASATALTGVSQVVNWRSQTDVCALKTDGSLWCWGNSAGSGYAVPYVDSSNTQVTSLTTIGRNCYLDANNLVWQNGYKYTSYQVTCP
jgi:alpha-tubulin suppressor-like RCC1 family protein